jgi:hypothetical protein
MISIERRACEKTFDEWLLTDSTMMSKVRKANNLIANWDGKGLPDLNKERVLRF